MTAKKKKSFPSSKEIKFSYYKCLGPQGRRRQDYGQDLFLAKLQITCEKKTLCSSGKTNQATFSTSHPPPPNKCHGFLDSLGLC